MYRKSKNILVMTCPQPSSCKAQNKTKGFFVNKRFLRDHNRAVLRRRKGSPRAKSKQHCYINSYIVLAKNDELEIFHLTFCCYDRCWQNSPIGNFVAGVAVAVVVAVGPSAVGNPRL